VVLQVCGNVMGLANQHSASRVIQWCLKEGSAADKAKLTAEIRTNILALSKSKYGRHVVQKLINVATKDEVPGEEVTGSGGGVPWGLLWVVWCGDVW
jgi:pumilio family protein 6